LSGFDADRLALAASVFGGGTGALSATEIANALGVV
jgi:hypothetical protein